MSYQKNWMFTVNNPAGEADEPAIFLQEFASYCIYQPEVGENGTYHYQGYVHFTIKKRMSSLKEMHSTAHWECRRGTHAEAKAYCCKDETRVPEGMVVEWGEEPSPGVRNDMIELKKSLDEGKNLQEVSDLHFGSFLKYSRGIKEYMMLHGELRDWITFTQVYWGSPGVGKSTRAKYEGGDSAYWLEKPNAGGALWFDGYDGQECVIIDEFYGWVSRDTMQRMCDSTPFRVQVKGGFVPFVPKRIIITSNSEPSEWWPKIGLGDQMKRRLEGIHGNICEMERVLDENLEIVVWQPEDEEMEVVRYDSDDEIFEDLEDLIELNQ